MKAKNIKTLLEIYADDDSTIRLPEYVIECWPFGDASEGLCISLVKKPNWFHRKMMTWCFGFKWRDLKT